MGESPLTRNIRRASQLTNRRSPILLAAAGITGTIVTAYLSGRASWKAANVIRDIEEEQGASEDPVQRTKDRAKAVWPLYVPTVISGTGTIASIAMSNKISSGRTAAAVSAYALTERAFSEYKEKVVEQIGENKELAIRDKIAEEKVQRNNPAKTIVLGSGQVLCCELYTKRYFMCDMETLKRTTNEINAAIISDLYVNLDVFYDSVGLPHTSHSNELGWDSDRLLELVFTTVLSEDGRPCIAFDYNYIKPI